MAQKRKRNKKWLFWVMIVVLFVTAVVVCYLVWDNYFRDKKDEENTVEQQSLVEDKDEVKEDSATEEETVEREKEKEQMPAYEGKNPNTNESLTGVVTYAGVSGESLVIRVNIDQYITEGSCELNLVQNGTVVYSDVAGIVGSAATATCEGFNVLTNRLGGGDYGVVIYISSGEKNGVINGEARI